MGRSSNRTSTAVASIGDVAVCICDKTSAWRSWKPPGDTPRYLVFVDDGYASYVRIRDVP